MGVGKRSTARVSFAQPLDLTKISNGIRARQDSAVCVSLSFKTTLSKSRGPTAKRRGPDLQWKQMRPQESNATKTAFRSLPGASPALQSDKVRADTKKTAGDATRPRNGGLNRVFRAALSSDKCRFFSFSEDFFQRLIQSRKNAPKSVPWRHIPARLRGHCPQLLIKRKGFTAKLVKEW